MKAYLIRFTYDYYCQGYEETEKQVLVYAENVFEACKKIEEKYPNARDFFNDTLGD